MKFVSTGRICSKILLFVLNIVFVFKNHFAFLYSKI